MKVGECFQWKAHGQCSRGYSCSFSHDPRAPVAKVRDQRTIVFSCIPLEGKTDWRRKTNILSVRQLTRKLFGKVKFHADSESSKNPSCKLWHPPVCLNYKSEKRCAHGDKCHFRHLEAEESPAKSRGKVVQKDQLLCWKSLYNWVVYLKLLIRENSTWTKKIGIKAVQEHLAQNK